jgi:hypothetical protein
VKKAATKAGIVITLSILFALRRVAVQVLTPSASALSILFALRHDEELRKAEIEKVTFNPLCIETAPYCSPPHPKGIPFNPLCIETIWWMMSSTIQTVPFNPLCIETAI